MPSQNSNLFREYIGAQGKGVRFTDVHINPKVEFHFILAFALDYDTSDTPSPTDGNFNIFWDKVNLGPDQVSSIKKAHPNVKVALSLGGDSGRNNPAYFSATSIESWVKNAVPSLTRIIDQYHLDGIDIAYDHFNADTDNTFVDCIGRLITTLKSTSVISFASIAPFNDEQVQNNYLALWKKYTDQIDYVNFQFYKFPKTTDTSSFLRDFEIQRTTYDGGKVLVSFNSDGSHGLSPANGFFDACTTLKNDQKLHGIFVWSADRSKALANGFVNEIKAQDLLADGH